MKNFNLLKNVFYFSGSALLFFAGMVVYGVVLNLRHVTLDEEMTAKNISSLNDVHIVVDRSNFSLDLYSDTILVKRYKAVFGKNRSSVKTSAFDYATPIGEYIICKIDTNTQYHKFFQINFPNIRDAAEAFKNGYINKEEHDLILKYYKKNECAPKQTRLGANIGIQGTGKYNYIFKNLPFVFNWTNGSIAISNENIDELYKIIKIGTPVKITN
ncbi:MAG: L,D-transpeptidase [Bacteroidetes bacterium]|nr:L,D-transpeptidase [Bacteroidota bacterium]